MIARALAFALMLLIANGSVVLGQDSAGRSRDRASNSPGRIPGMVATSHIMFVTHFGPRIRGHDPLISGDSLHVQVGRESQVFALSNIDTVWVRRGTWARNAGLTTGALGALLGGFAGVALSHDEGHHPSTGEEAGAVVVAGLIVGAIWAVPGAAAGSIFPRWERVYVRPGGSP